MISKSQLKYIQSLGQKKRRDEEALFIAEGPKLVSELLQQSNLKVQELFAVTGWIESVKLISGNTKINEVSEAELEWISQLTTPNQVLAVVEKIKWPGPLLLNGMITLALDTIQDPGNLGTIIRTADWFGIRQIVCSRESADVYNPKVVQASMGSIGRVRVEYEDLAEWLAGNKKINIYAASLDGEDLTRMEKLSEGIIIIGNESKGIQDAVLKLAHKKITIPGKGEAESLNAAVAAGILLSHLC